MSVNLRGLIAKLNAPTRSGIEAAAGICLSRTNYDIEIEHFLVKLLDTTDSDVAAILKYFGVNRSRLADDLARALDRLKTGNARTPSLSPSLVRLLSDAWLQGSVEYGAPRVRTGHCLLALVSVSELARLAAEISREFEKIAPDVLKKEFLSVTVVSTEAKEELGSIDSMASTASASGSGEPTKAGGRTPNLDQYTVDLTANAKAGKIDAVLGRDAEVRQVVDILTRRRKDGCGGRVRAAHRRRGRAAAAAQRVVAFARPRDAAGRRRREG
jgi:type VI secretion system protein VasG